jgi:hypothetical protein
MVMISSAAALFLEHERDLVVVLLRDGFQRGKVLLDMGIPDDDDPLRRSGRVLARADFQARVQV